jgi:glycosyltransferase involved in cell wall biosynthesis
MKQLDKTLTIGFPTYGQIDPAVMVQMCMLINYSPFKMFEILNPQNMIVDEARNFIIDKMKGDYLLFIDSDIVPPIDVIPRLLEHGKDVVTGLYFTKNDPFYPVIFKKSDAEGRYDTKVFYEKDKLIEVDSAGLGCALIKREVLDKIGAPWFKFTTGWGKETRESEDHYFFRRCREEGYKIYCDTTIKCGHIGKLKVIEPMWEAMREQEFPANKPVVK